jgi:hypothetical protein
MVPLISLAVHERASKTASVHHPRSNPSWLIVTALVAIGCNSSECEQRRSCKTAAVPGETGDLVFELHSGSVTFTTDTSESEHEPDSSTMVVTPPDSDCRPGPTAPCSLLLKHFEVGFGHLNLVLTSGEQLPIDDALVSLAEPVELKNFGFNYVIDAGQTFQTCASVDGRRQSARAASAVMGGVGFSEELGVFTIDATFPMIVRRNDEECSEFALTGRAELMFLPAPAEQDGGR